MTTPDYGTDVSTYVVNDEGEPDLDPSFGIISGGAAVAECQARRLETPNGSLPWDTDAGYDLLRLVNAADVSPLIVQSSVDVEMRKDERVDDVDVTATKGPAGVVSIAVAGSGGAGPFALVVQPPNLSTAITIITAGNT